MVCLEGSHAGGSSMAGHRSSIFCVQVNNVGCLLMIDDACKRVLREAARCVLCHPAGSGREGGGEAQSKLLRLRTLQTDAGRWSKQKEAEEQSREAIPPGESFMSFRAGQFGTGKTLGDDRSSLV